MTFIVEKAPHYQHDIMMVAHPPVANDDPSLRTAQLTRMHENLQRDGDGVLENCGDVPVSLFQQLWVDLMVSLHAKELIGHYRHVFFGMLLETKLCLLIAMWRSGS